jgi:hypothetical protein
MKRKTQFLAQGITIVFLYILICIVVFSISLPHPLYAKNAGEEIDTIKSSAITVQFEKPLLNAAKDLVAIYPTAKMELEKTLEWKIEFQPVVLLIKSSSTFQRMAGSDIIVAFAIPERYLIVIDYSKMGVQHFKLDTTLKHELCHVLLHHYIKNDLPKWLDEGVSQWASSGMAEIISDTKYSALDEAVLSERFLRFEDLSVNFPQDKDSLMLAYEESKSMVEYIDTRFGTAGLLQILNNIRNGYEAHRAIQMSLLMTFEELETDWHNYLRNSITWFVYLSNNLYKILFFIAALITVYAFIKITIKKLTHKKDTDE